jgi:hypothetical protein
MPRNLLEGIDTGNINRRPRNLLEGVDLTKATIPDVVPFDPGPSTLGNIVGGIKTVDDYLAGAADTTVDLGAGMAGWGVGAIAGTGGLLGEKLRGGTPTESQRAFDVGMEKYGGMVTEGIREPWYTVFEPSKSGARASEIASEGIDLALTGARTLANVEGDLYKRFGLRPLEETHPGWSRLAGLGVELMSFKAAHSVGKGTINQYNRLADRMRALQKKPRSQFTPEDVQMAEFVAEQISNPENIKLLEWNPEEVATTVRDFKLGRVTEETQRRPIRAEGPVEGQKLLPEETTSVKNFNVVEGGKGRGASSEVLKPTQIDRYHEGTSVPAVRDAIESGDIASARAIYNQTRLKKSPIWGEKIAQEIANAEAKGLRPSKASIEDNWAELERLINKEKKQPGSVIDNDIYVLSGRIGDSRIANALTKSTPESRLIELERLIDERKMPKKGATPETLKKAREAKAEKAETKIGKTEITEELLPKRRTVEEAESELRGMVPEIGQFLEKGGEAKGLKERIDTVLNDLDPNNALHADVYTAGERLLVEISKKEKGVKTPRDLIERGKRDAQRIREDARQVYQGRVVEEGGAKEGRTDLELTERAEGVKEVPQVVPEAAPIGTKFVREKGGLYKSEDGGVVIAKEGSTWSIADGKGNVQTEGFKTLRDAKAGFESAMRAEVREVLEPKVVTPEASAERLDLIRERHQKLKKEGVEDVDEFLAETERKTRKQAKEDSELLGEEYDTLMDDDWHIADYGVAEMAQDAYRAFLKGEEGSIFRGGDLTPERIQAIHRMWQKSKDMGRNLGEYLKAMMPEMSDSDVVKVEQFAEKHFVQKKTFRTPEGKGDVLQTVKKRRERKVAGRIVSYPKYYKKYLDMWNGMKKVKFSKAVGGKQGTVARVFFDQFPILANEVYYPWRRAFKVAKVRKRHVRDILSDLKKTVDKQSRRRVRDYAMWVQAEKSGNIEILKTSGINAKPKLTKPERLVYETLREGFDRFYEEINNMRVGIGKNPFKKVDDYFTFLRAIGKMEKLGLTGEAFTKEASHVMNEYARMKATPFRFAKKRGKGVFRLEDDPFKIFKTYTDMAIDHIEISPIVAKVRTMLEPVKDPGKAKITKKGNITQQTFNPIRSVRHKEAAKYLNNWSHKISGIPMGFDAVHPTAAKWLGKVNRNLGASILGGSLRSALIQPTAILNTYAEIGLEHTVKGIVDMTSPKKNRSAMLKSEVLYPRNFDATIGELLGDLKDIKVGDFPKFARNFSMQGLQKLDMLTARATWNAGFSKGKKLGMNEAQAARYADDVVTKTQASGAPGELAPIQYTSIGKTLTMFQTFVINNWNFLVHDVVGAGKNATVGEIMPKVIRYVLGAAMVNFVYEDLAGMKSPLPRPIRSGMDSLDEGNTGVDVALDVAKESIELLPILGNARYGSNPFGPLVQKGGEAFELLDKKKRRGDKALELTGNALGVPGTGQAAKSYRAAKRGESTWGIAVGTYTEKPKGRRRRRSRMPGR